MTSSSPLLAARGAARRFGHTSALEPVELEVWDREAVALVGPNGAGKSTLLSLLAGALEPSAGRIERRNGVRVGWAPQRTAQYGRLSARENLELFARLEGEHDPRAAAERLLAEFELPGEPAPSANLSVGNRQRLNLAISQLGSPEVLLLDEPTAALDPEQRRRLWARVAALREAGGAIVFATQNLEEVDRIADRVVVLRDGRLVFAGSVADYDRSHVETLSA
ncbi:MAG: ABC transporter ATP-binding protein [Gaiellaceae bacterium]